MAEYTYDRNRNSQAHFLPGHEEPIQEEDNYAAADDNDEEESRHLMSQLSLNDRGLFGHIS